MAWRPAHSLTVLRNQLWAAYWWTVPPATPAASWGMIGDLAHSSTSDHAPKDFPGWGSDIVTALDFPHRPDLQLDAFTIVEAIRVSRDPRVKYVIFNRRQYSSYVMNGIAPYTWRPYSGSNPHTDHAHVSVVGDVRADGTQPWSIGEVPVSDISATGTPNAWVEAVRIDALLRGSPSYVVDWGTGPVTEHNAVAAGFAAVLAALAQPVPVTMTEEQLEHLADLIAARVPAAPSPETIADAVVDEIAS